MFFRVKKTPSGQVMQLIESFRDSMGRARNRVVVSLGNADIPEELSKSIAKAVENKLYNKYDGTLALFPEQYSAKEQHWIDTIIRHIDNRGTWRPYQGSTSAEASSEEGVPEEETVDGVLINKVEHCSDTGLGPELAGLHAWNELGVGNFLKSMGFNDKQCACAASAVINKLVEPLSEHALVQWLHDTSLPDLLGGEILQGGEDVYYRLSDKLLKHQSQIIKHLVSSEQKYFKLSRSVLLYDLTNTYFEGTALENPLAKRDCSKHKRNDCPQIVLGMVFDNNGFELGHKIFEGNRNDATTLEEMLSELGKGVISEDTLFDGIKPIVILDGGIATKENLKMLKDNNYSYLVNDSRRGRGKYEKEFLEEEAFSIVPGREEKGEVFVRLIPDPYNQANETEDILLLCKSASRKLKEMAIRSKMEERFIEELEKLKVSIGKGNIKGKEAIERKIGKIQTRYSRAAKYYEIELKEKAELYWQLRSEKYQTDDNLFGSYVIRTDRKDLKQDEIWQLYMTLTRAEDGFRMLKSNLGLRPNHHRLEDRVDGHVLITVLAYHVLHFIMYKLRLSGDHRSWPVIRRILSTHCYSTIIVPTINGTIHRIRKSGLPDETQKAIYRTIGVSYKNLPHTRSVITKVRN
ncbi:MAG TPA: IS1634 family transposase [Lentisphaeria bacterium]|nr:MAG: hypothetical protein A2X47_08050 [Lentisphaerae bacterium GWF2_38_69]HBM16421.1 IS1634 family transposase [Lentisphaeria bacterium]